MQSNELLLQSFNIASNGPVAIANDGSQSNYSDQDSFVPVGSLFVTVPLMKALLPVGSRLRAQSLARSSFSMHRPRGDRIESA